MTDQQVTFTRARPARYTVTDNTVIEDPQLSPQASYWITYLEGRPDGWQVRMAHLATVKRAGRTAVESALKELLDAGYMRRWQTRDEHGRITGVAYEFAAQPLWADDPGRFGTTRRRRPKAGQPKPENPDTDSPNMENPRLISTEVQQLLKEQPTTPPPKASSSVDPVAVGLANLLAGYLADLGTLNKRSRPEDWAVDIDRMIRLDGVDPGDIAEFVEWLFEAEDRTALFWRTNIESGSKLRAQFARVQARRRTEAEAARLTARPHDLVPLAQSMHPAAGSSPVDPLPDLPDDNVRDRIRSTFGRSGQ